jgi:hypothetical protein
MYIDPQPTTNNQYFSPPNASVAIELMSDGTSCPALSLACPAILF